MVVLDAASFPPIARRPSERRHRITQAIKNKHAKDDRHPRTEKEFLGSRVFFHRSERPAAAFVAVL